MEEIIGGVCTARESGAPECHYVDCTPGPYARLDSFVGAAVMCLGVSSVCVSEIYAITYGILSYTVKSVDGNDVSSVGVYPSIGAEVSTVESLVEELRSSKPGST